METCRNLDDEDLPETIGELESCTKILLHPNLDTDKIPTSFCLQTVPAKNESWNCRYAAPRSNFLGL